MSNALVFIPAGFFGVTNLLTSLAMPWYSLSFFWLFPNPSPVPPLPTPMSPPLYNHALQSYLGVSPLSGIGPRGERIWSGTVQPV